MDQARASRLPRAARLLLATAWVGVSWGIGYVAAPTLFAHLERMQAGTIAGWLFRVEAMVSLVAGVLLLLLLMWRSDEMDAAGRRRCLQLVAVMLLATVLGYYGLQPMMAELKAAAGPGGVMDGDTARRFGMLHGLSSVIYLIKSLAGAWLVLRLR